MKYLAILATLSVSACGASVPDDLKDYEQRCIRLNQAPIPKYPGDPHAGMKNVYVCNLSADEVAKDVRPFPDGAMVVKDSQREGEDFKWLIATARKQNGRWSWDEYTRNFSNEEMLGLLTSDSKCLSCHKRAVKDDYIFTRYDRLVP